MATIQKRGNSYRLRASAGYDAKGKQIVRSMTWTPAPGMTKKQIAKELERQKVKFDEQVKTGQFLDGNIKFQEFSEEWFESYGKEHLRERTYQRYKELSVRTYAAIGHIPIQKLQPQHLLAFYRQLGSEGIRAGAETAVPRERFQELLADRQWTQAFLSQTSGLAPSTIGAAVKGKSISSKSASAIAQAFEEPVENLFTLKKDQTPLSSKTIRHYHTFISSVLERAVKWQLIPGNPCHRIDPPKVDHKEIKFMQEGELERFIECLSQEPIEYQSAFLILVLTGMRRGELMGLEWPDIDLEEGRIMIRRTSQYSAQKGIYTDTTKTEQSKRSISIPQELCQKLREYRAWQNEQRLKMGDQWDSARQNSPRLFCQWNGKPMHPGAPYQELQKYLKRIGLERMSLHSLRHTNATLLIGAGTDLRTVSGRLGHSQASTTLNIYSHQLKTADKAAAEILSQKVLHGKASG